MPGTFFPAKSRFTRCPGVADQESSTAAAISLDELIALNDEIAALVRAGVPLEQGLGHLGGDMPGRLGKIATMFAQRMQRGESLAQILAEQSEHIPPVYRAVVEAGLKTGHLSAALESVAGSARRLADIRRVVAAGFLYPLLVVLVAWGLFVLFTVVIAPAVLDAYVGFAMPGRGPLILLAEWGKSAVYWGPVVPVAVVLLAGWWWVRSGRASFLQPQSSGLLLAWLPWLGRMLRSFRTATFTEVLALLVENRVPLPEGIMLAAEASGDRKMWQTARQIADRLSRGQTLPSGEGRGGGFPPLLTWLIQSNQHRAALLPALEHAAKIYRQRALRQAEFARVFLPILLSVAIGGSVTLFYALLVFVPWLSLLYSLS